MVHTPSPRPWGIILLSSTFLFSLAYTQCSMWNSFALISHHYWTPQKEQNKRHQQSSTPNEYKMNPMIIFWTQKSKALDNKGSKFIESSKQGNSYTKASGSLGAKFTRNFVI
jgi:hypothetical protein